MSEFILTIVYKHFSKLLYSPSSIINSRQMILEASVHCNTDSFNVSEIDHRRCSLAIENGVLYDPIVVPLEFLSNCKLRKVNNLL